MATKYYLVKNDTRPQLTFTCKDEDGNAINLTGATVKFIFKKLGATTKKFKKDCSITDAANGVCKYTFVSGDLDEAGDYWGELEITFAGGSVQTNKNYIRFNVREDLD